MNTVDLLTVPLNSDVPNCECEWENMFFSFNNCLKFFYCYNYILIYITITSDASNFRFI